MTILRWKYSLPMIISNQNIYGLGPFFNTDTYRNRMTNIKLSYL